MCQRPHYFAAGCTNNGLCWLNGTQKEIEREREKYTHKLTSTSIQSFPFRAWNLIQYFSEMVVQRSKSTRTAIISTAAAAAAENALLTYFHMMKWKSLEISFCWHSHQIWLLNCVSVEFRIRIDTGANVYSFLFIAQSLFVHCWYWYLFVSVTNVGSFTQYA